MYQDIVHSRQRVLWWEGNKQRTMVVTPLIDQLLGALLIYLHVYHNT